MKIKILSLIAIAGVLTASQAQPTLGTISSSTNRIPTGNSTFAERLNNIINNTSFTRLAGIDTRAGGLIIRRFTNIGYVTGSSLTVDGGGQLPKFADAAAGHSERK